MKYLIALLSIIFIIGCGEKGSTNESVIAAADKNPEISSNNKILRNELEDSLDYIDGNIKKYWNYKDKGGLNSESNLYGINITQMQISYNEDKITGATLIAQVGTAPLKIRESLSKLCHLKESDWTIRNEFEPMGEGKAEGRTCYYLITSRPEIQIVYK
jgi:UDP-N-acetylglucosamine 2-epimerase